MARARTRMQKSWEGLSNPALGVGAADIKSYQLEGGDEECQIKRLVCSMGTSGNHGAFAVALADVPFVTAADFTDNRIITDSEVGNNSTAQINHTTTIRVPRGWHLGILVTNRGGANPLSYGVTAGLHYLVLS